MPPEIITAKMVADISNPQIDQTKEYKFQRPFKMNCKENKIGVCALSCFFMVANGSLKTGFFPPSLDIALEIET